jgi:hypothetical protein
MGVIVSGFPGCGRRYLKTNCRDGITVENVKVSDYDSDGFPDNYVDYVLSIVDKTDIVLISSHPAICEELNSRGVDFNLFYPERSRRNEFVENFVMAHKPAKQIQEIDNKWTEWIDLIEERTLEHCFKHSLSKGQFIGNFSMMNAYVYNLLNGNKGVITAELKSDYIDAAESGIQIREEEIQLTNFLFTPNDLQNLSYIVNECNEKFEKFKPDSVGILIDKDTFETLNKIKTWLEKRIKHEPQDK